MLKNIYDIRLLLVELVKIYLVTFRLAFLFYLFFLPVLSFSLLLLVPLHRAFPPLMLATDMVRVCHSGGGDSSVVLAIQGGHRGAI